MNIRTISILGCGWLGLPLAKFLTEKNFSVKGSVTSQEKLESLRKEEIELFKIKITEKEIIASQNDLNVFFNCEVLIVNFPPERRPDIESYLSSQMDLLISAIKSHGIKKVIFVSSTAVLPDLNREVSEHEAEEPAKGSGKALKIAEEKLMQEKDFQTTVLRFGGLIGYDRMPGRFLARKKNVENGDAPVNLIHQDDCIGIIEAVITKEVWGELFNACADKHPKRKDYYIKAAGIIGVEPPEFSEEKVGKFKIVNSDKLKTRLAYNFKYPDPMALLEMEGV